MHGFQNFFSLVGIGLSFVFWSAHVYAKPHSLSALTKRSGLYNPQHFIPSAIVISGRPTYTFFSHQEQLTEKDLKKIIEILVSDQRADQITELKIDGNLISKLPSNLYQLTNLRKLSLVRNKLRKFPKVIQHLPYLEELDISQNQIKTFHNIPLLPQLHSLRMGSNPIQDLDLAVFGQFPNLKKLFIFELNVTSLKGFPFLPELTNLDLDNCKLTDFQGLPSLPKLEWLLARSNGIESLEHLPSLPGLKYLFLADNRIQSLSFLNDSGSLPLLEQLILASNQIHTLSGFDRLSRLKKLTVDYNPIAFSMSETEFKARFPHLQHCSALTP